MIEWLQVGRKVVCVVEPSRWATNVPAWREAVKNYPVENGIYTIRAVRDGLYCETGKPSLGVLLQEVHNAFINVISLGWVEPDFDYKAFRPLQSTETGMEILRRALDDARRQSQERVKETT